MQMQSERVRDRDKVFVEGQTRSLKVSNALEVVDSICIPLALPVAIVAFALCIFLFISFFFNFSYLFLYLFCTVHWARRCCFGLRCCCRYCIQYLCICVWRIFCCAFLFFGIASVCACVCVVQSQSD